MPVTRTLYNEGKFAFADGESPFYAMGPATKVMLVTSAYVPNFATHVHRSDVTNELTGTNYVAGGNVIPTIASTKDDINNVGKITGGNVVFANLTTNNPIRGAVMYVVVGSAATDYLLEYMDFGQEISCVAEDFTIQWNANGIYWVRQGS